MENIDKAFEAVQGGPELIEDFPVFEEDGRRYIILFRSIDDISSAFRVYLDELEEDYGAE